MKYLVTGGNGLLGREICTSLTAEGHEVVSIDVTTGPREAPFQRFRCDITDVAKIENLMQGVQKVIHTAAVVPMRKAGSDYFRINAEGTRTVLSASIKAGVKHFTYVSSSAVYGVDGEDGGRSSPSLTPTPAEPYGHSKLEGEYFCRARESEIKLAILRPRTIVGPGRMGIFSVLFDRIKSSKNIYVLGDGRQLLQLISLADSVRLTIACSRAEVIGVLNLGGPDPKSMRETLETLCAFAHSRSRVISLPAAPAKLTLLALDKLRLSPFAPWHYKTLDRSMNLNISLTNEKLGNCHDSSVGALLSSYSSYVSAVNGVENFADALTHREAANPGIFKFF